MWLRKKKKRKPRDRILKYFKFHLCSNKLKYYKFQIILLAFQFSAVLKSVCSKIISI